MSTTAWQALLDEFRALGGTAENLEMRHGVRGRGLFPIDSAKPVRLAVPPNLLVPMEDVELRDGRLVVKASSTLGERERGFFGRYHRDLAWSAGLLEELWQGQLEWRALPPQIKGTLEEIGWIVDVPTRFSEPSEELCLRRYLQTRVMMYQGAGVLTPLMELLNHSDAADGFDMQAGVSVGGLFGDEVLVNYGCDDCWGRALYHGFCDATGYALSLAFSYQADDIRIEIRREYFRRQQYNGVQLPVVSAANGTVEFSHLILGHIKYPLLPRSLFLHVAANTPIRRPDELFDIIQHYNRMQFLRYLRVAENPTTPLAAMLRSAAYQQLATLSNYWGTAPVSPH
jgi:hypothetical protein